MVSRRSPRWSILPARLVRRSPIWSRWNTHSKPYSSPFFWLAVAALLPFGLHVTATTPQDHKFLPRCYAAHALRLTRASQWIKNRSTHSKITRTQWTRWLTKEISKHKMILRIFLGVLDINPPPHHISSYVLLWTCVHIFGHHTTGVESHLEDCSVFMLLLFDNNDGWLILLLVGRNWSSSWLYVTLLWII